MESRIIGIAIMASLRGSGQMLLYQQHKFHKCRQSLTPTLQRMFGRGPQAQWTSNSHVDRELVVGFTGKTLAELEHEYRDQIDAFQLWFPVWGNDSRFIIYIIRI